MHGAAAPAATAIALAIQLSHQGIGRHTLGQRMAMATVCAGDPVGLAQMRTNPDARGLLADVEVQKTRRLAFSAGDLGSELEPTQQQHLFVQPQHLGDCQPCWQSLRGELRTCIAHNALQFLEIPRKSGRPPAIDRQDMAGDVGAFRGC